MAHFDIIDIHGFDSLLNKSKVLFVDESSIGPNYAIQYVNVYSQSTIEAFSSMFKVPIRKSDYNWKSNSRQTLQAAEKIIFKHQN